MVSETGSGTGIAFLLIGGAIFLKPRDVLTLSRGAGRLCGSAVVVLRGARKAVAETMASETPTEFKGMRESVFNSFKQIEDISRTLTKEVADASPVANLRAATSFRPKRKTETPTKPKNVGPLTSSDGRLIGLSSVNDEASGADIVSRVIEESAFAEQHARILGSSLDSETRKE